MSHTPATHNLTDWLHSEEDGARVALIKHYTPESSAVAIDCRAEWKRIMVMVAPCDCFVVYKGKYSKFDCLKTSKRISLAERVSSVFFSVAP